MKKKLSVFIVLLLGITMMLGSNAEATQGKLTTSSIEKCGGTLWGYHNPTRRHYHKAVYHKKSGYYALDWSHEYKKVGNVNISLVQLKRRKRKKVLSVLTQVAPKNQVATALKITVPTQVVRQVVPV